MKTGIIVAMGTEFRMVEALLTEKKTEEIHGLRFVTGRLEKKEVVLAQSGIGKVCAAVGTVEMIRNYHPDTLLNTGVAGGIDERLQIMDMVVGKEVVYHDVWCGDGNLPGQIQGMPARFACDARLYEAAMAAHSDVGLHGGLICSGDRFVTDGEVLAQIKRDFPEGMAVDMESGAIAQVCHMYGVPFLSCRVMSDTPGKGKDNFGQYLDFWKTAPEKSFEVLRQIVERI